jgi:hypothetical protein
MGEVQVLNKADKVAVEVALRSHVDDVFLVTRRGVFKLEKGKYGGWLLRPPLEDLDVAYGVWCYNVEKKDDEQVGSTKVKDVQEKVAKVANSLGVNKKPLVSLVVKKFRVVKAVLKKATERYSVYDIEPADEEATAALAYVHYHVWWSRRGKCHGELCDVLDKFSKLLKAEFKEGAEAGDAGVYVPYDVSALAAVVGRLSAAEEEVAEAEEKADAEEGGDGGWDSYFIVVKLPPGSGEVVTKLEEAVRQKLKELNITAAVWSVKADL